jgi:hypothetical protein
MNLKLIPSGRNFVTGRCKIIHRVPNHALAAEAIHHTIRSAVNGVEFTPARVVLLA